MEEIHNEVSTCGKRLKTMRLMGDLTRRALEAQYSISASTLQAWETGKCRLTERGAQRVLSALEEEGIYCTLDWLLHGRGLMPQQATIGRLTKKSLQPTATLPESEAISKELIFFRSLHKDALVFRVADDGMMPHYSVNDHIAGKRRTDTRINHLIGMDCIVQTPQNQLLFRRLLKGTHAQLYNLICTNINTTVSSPLLYDQQVVNAAPVIWHRRYDKDAL